MQVEVESQCKNNLFSIPTPPKWSSFYLLVAEEWFDSQVGYLTKSPTTRHRCNVLASSGVAQSDRAPNNNCKVASLILSLGVTRSCVLGKDT